MVGNPALTNRNPLAPSDRSVVEVKIRFAPQAGDEKEKAEQLKLATKEAAARVGVQVSIEFEPLEKETEVGDDAKDDNRS